MLYQFEIESNVIKIKQNKITKIPNATMKIKLEKYIVPDRKMGEKYKKTKIIMEPQLKLYFPLVIWTLNRLKSCFTRDTYQKPCNLNFKPQILCFQQKNLHLPEIFV